MRGVITMLWIERGCKAYCFRDTISFEKPIMINISRTHAIHLCNPKGHVLRSSC